MQSYDRLNDEIELFRSDLIADVDLMIRTCKTVNTQGRSIISTQNSTETSVPSDAGAMFWETEEMKELIISKLKEANQMDIIESLKQIIRTKQIEGMQVAKPTLLILHTILQKHTQANWEWAVR